MEDTNEQEIVEEQEEINEEIEPIVICQFVYHPATDEVILEATSDADYQDIRKCYKILRDHVEEAEVAVNTHLMQSVQQILVKQNATLESIKVMLKHQMEIAGGKSASSTEKKYRGIIKDPKLEK